MDSNIFRLKKSRETARTKSNDIVSGTLDSIHKNIVSSFLALFFTLALKTDFVSNFFLF